MRGKLRGRELHKGSNPILAADLLAINQYIITMPMPKSSPTQSVSKGAVSVGFVSFPILLVLLLCLNAGRAGSMCLFKRPSVF